MMKSDPNPTKIAKRIDSKRPKLQPIAAKDAVAATSTYTIEIPEKSARVNEREVDRITRAAQLITMSEDSIDAKSSLFVLGLRLRVRLHDHMMMKTAYKLYRV